MSIDPSAVRPRRSFLAAAAGAGIATVAAVVVRPPNVEAASGAFDSADSNTPAVTGTNSATTGAIAAGVSGVSSSINGVGVYGSIPVDGFGDGVMGQTAASYGRGVYGTATSLTGTCAGVVGYVQSPSATGVVGCAGSYFTSSAAPKTGVFGVADADAASRGVLGASLLGTGVHGVAGTVTPAAPPANTGVFGSSATGTGGRFASTSGVALQAQGKVRLSRSGKANVGASKTYIDVTVPGGLAANSVVTATIQMYRAGVAVAGVRLNYPAAGKARIYLTKVASTSSVTPVAWIATEYGA